MSSKRVERQHNALGHGSASGVLPRHRDQTWTPNDPIVFSTSTNSDDLENTSIAAGTNTSPILEIPKKRVSENGSSRRQSKASRHTWEHGQDIYFFKLQERNGTGLSNGSSQASKKHHKSHCSNAGTILDYESTMKETPVEGSSQIKRPKKVEDHLPAHKEPNSSRSLRSMSSPGPVLPALPSKFLSSQPQLNLVKSSSREKSTLSPKSNRSMPSLKPKRGLPLPEAFKPQSSSPETGQDATKRGFTPVQSKKLSTPIPIAESAEMVRRREEAERQQRELAERQKADANKREEEAKQTLWESPLRKRVDQKFSSIVTKLQTNSQELNRLVEDSRHMLIAIRRRKRDMLRRLQDEKRRVQAAIENSRQEMQLVESNLRIKARTDRWVNWDRIQAEIRRKFAAITIDPKDTPVGKLMSLRSEFKDYFGASMLDHRQLSPLEILNNDLSVFNHFWQKYFRMKLVVNHSPARAAWDYSFALAPILAIVENMIDNARNVRSDMFNIIKGFEGNAHWIQQARTNVTFTISHNIVETCRQISKLLSRDLAGLGYTLLWCMNARLSRWQRQTWRPFIMQDMMLSDFSSELWDFCSFARNIRNARDGRNVWNAWVPRDSEVAHHVLPNSELTKLIEGARKLDWLRRDLRQTLKGCMESSWARASADLAQGVLPSVSLQNLHLWTPGARTHNTKQKVAHRHFHTKGLTEHQSHWHFNNHQSPNGKQITLHLCTSVFSSERVAQLFLQDDVLGFDLEWRINAPAGHSDNVALLQLANEERIALFHLAAMQDQTPTSYTGSTPSHIPRIGPTLRSILENRDVLKVGVAIKADSTRLAKIYCVDMAGLFELTHLYKQLEYRSGDKTPISKRLVSLAQQTQKYLGLPLAKGDERCSAWHEQLTREQMIYAANDVYASVVLFNVMNQRRLSLNPRPPLPSLAEDNVPIPVPIPAALRGSSPIDNDYSKPDDLKSGLSNQSHNPSFVDKANAAHSDGVFSLENSVNVEIDGAADQARPDSSRRYAADVAKRWAIEWQNSTKPDKKIVGQALQAFYLAQKFRWSLEDISLALKIASKDSIAQSLLGLTKETDLKLDEDYRHNCQLRVCLGQRAEYMSAETKDLLKSNKEALRLSEMWCKSHPEQHRESLQAYGLRFKYGLSLGEIAVTMEMNYRVVADRILAAVIISGRKTNLSILRQLVMYSRNAEVKEWFNYFVKSNPIIQPQLAKAGSDEDNIILSGIRARVGSRTKSALFGKPLDHRVILLTSIGPVKHQPRHRRRVAVKKALKLPERPYVRKTMPENEQSAYQ